MSGNPEDVLNVPERHILRWVLLWSGRDHSFLMECIGNATELIATASYRCTRKWGWAGLRNGVIQYIYLIFFY